MYELLEDPQHVMTVRRKVSDPNIPDLTDQSDTCNNCKNCGSAKIDSKSQSHWTILTPGSAVLYCIGPMKVRKWQLLGKLVQWILFLVLLVTVIFNIIFIIDHKGHHKAEESIYADENIVNEKKHIIVKNQIEREEQIAKRDQNNDKEQSQSEKANQHPKPSQQQQQQLQKQQQQRLQKQPGNQKVQQKQGNKEKHKGMYDRRFLTFRFTERTISFKNLSYFQNIENLKVSV